MNEGWKCPECKRVNAPFVKECPCSAAKKEDSRLSDERWRELFEEAGKKLSRQDKQEQPPHLPPLKLAPYNPDPCLTCPNRGKGPCYCTIPYMTRTIC